MKAQQTLNPPNILTVILIKRNPIQCGLKLSLTRVKAFWNRLKNYGITTTWGDKIFNAEDLTDFQSNYLIMNCALW